MKRLIALFLMFEVVQAGPLPIADGEFPLQDPSLVQLGQLLFYDPILSGGKAVSCASCHHPRHGTSDGLSLGLGDGSHGLGLKKIIDDENAPEQRIPRNSPALFNLGATEFAVMFHDGRLERDKQQPSGVRTPLGAEMVAGFSGVLSAQSMFPVLSPDEMAGHYSENEIAQAVRQGLLTGSDGAWHRISQRVLAVDHYRSSLEAIFGQETDLGFVHISDALAAFMASEWRSDDSAFDRYLRGGEALPEQANRGMNLFYGKARCDRCHAGQFQTDHDFHAIAMPQLGPGKAARFERHARDEGRMRVTGDPSDAYAFRTPSLRNVSETAPYGHSGAYATLEAVVRHHLDPVGSLLNYDRSQVVLPDLRGAVDWRVLEDEDEFALIAAANELDAQKLSDDEVSDLLAFLKSLNDSSALTGRLGIPDTVPSGLPVDR